jgi:caffeoyl-CoA O-methyltransferase
VGDKIAAMPRGVKTEFSEALSDYLAEHSRQDEVLAAVEREIVGDPRARMQVPPDQGALLTLLVRAINARTALEVGTFTGYSAICIARGLPDDGTLVCLELDPELARTARRNLDTAGFDDQTVAIHVGPAKASLEAMPAQPTFDFAFVDADKPSYLDYYELVLERLNPGGVMLMDNTLLRGRVLDPPPGDAAATTVATLNDRVARDDRVDSAMAFIADGVTFVRKR